MMLMQDDAAPPSYSPDRPLLLGVDTGGTFTDFVLYDGAGLHLHKVLSTPADPAQAIIQGIRELGLLSQLQRLQVVHGSTVGTNAVLEGKGVSTLYVSNRGFADVLTLGRQARRQLYELQPQALAPPVPASHCLEVGARCAADGSELSALSEDDLVRLRAAVQQLKPAAVAVNLLFSFRNDSHERALAAALDEDVFVSLSSEVLPEYREYERGMATWLNAWIGPLLGRYLRQLAQQLRGAGLAVMQSSGGTIRADQAARHAVRLLLSGPAGGLAGVRHLAGLSGHSRLLSFDMGGTSTDVALVDGELRLTSEGRIGPYPVAVPMVDMHTIGAGGGSIATVDAGGLLQVGPQSAGAMPGPACYGLGGTRATVTDANLVLGRLLPDSFLGGRMRLQPAQAEAAVGAIAQALGVSLAVAAQGIVDVANEHMARALRVISVQRGDDPRALTLVSFGGAGGLHVCALADALQMRQAMVPRYGGVLSALGMLVASPSRELSRTVNELLGDAAAPQVEQCLAQLTAQAAAELRDEGVDESQMQASASVDLRYLGQTYTLPVPWQGVAASARQFTAQHQQRYGHALDLPVELVNVRLRLQGERPSLAWPPTPGGGAPPLGSATLVGYSQAVPVYSREAIPARAMAGPLLITEEVATTYVAAGWLCRRDAAGNLLLHRQ